jgi:hypothetical protein
VKDVKDPNRVRFVGPLAEYADGFRRELVEHGFAPASATRQLELMANVSRWLADGGLVVGELTPRRVEMFVVARREAGFRNRARPDRLVRYLRSVGAVPELPSAGDGVSGTELLLERYRSYLVFERMAFDVHAFKAGVLCKPSEVSVVEVHHRVAEDRVFELGEGGVDLCDQLGDRAEVIAPEATARFGKHKPVDRLEERDPSVWSKDSVERGERLGFVGDVDQHRAGGDDGDAAVRNTEEIFGPNGNELRSFERPHGLDGDREQRRRERQLHRHREPTSVSKRTCVARTRTRETTRQRHAADAVLYRSFLRGRSTGCAHTIGGSGEVA